MIARFEITLPSNALMRQFGEIASTSFRQREVLALQNQTLRAARDLLLPRLITGADDRGGAMALLASIEMSELSRR